MVNALIFGWVFLGTLSLLGWGLLAAGLAERFGRLDNRDAWFAPHLFLLGLTSLTALGLLANFWIPITNQAGALTMPLGLLVVVLQRRRIATLGMVLLALWFAVAWVWLILPFEQFSFDAGLYHLQYMQWMAQRPVFPGLAQLQTRFGFDSSWLLFVATQRIDLDALFGLNVSPWLHYVVAELMLRALLFWWAALAIKAAVSGKDRPAGEVTLYVVLVLMLSMFMWRMKETSTDVAPNVVALAVWLCGFESWMAARAQQSTQAVRSFSAMMCSSAFVVVSKLSVLPILLLLLPVGWVVRPRLREIAVPLALFGLMLSLWLIRNVVLTGCLVYPAAATCTSLPWSLGAKQAAFEAWDITTFARLYGNTSTDALRAYVTHFSWDALALWAPKFFKSFYFRLPAAGCVVGLLAWVFFRRFKIAAGLSGYLGLSLLVGALGFGYWLVLGPDPRFSWAFSFIATLSVMVFGLARLPTATFESCLGRWPSMRYARLVLPGLCVGVLCLTLLRPPNFFFDYDLQTEFVQEPYAGQLFWRATGGIGLCGDKIPCATYFHDGLKWIVR